MKRENIVAAIIVILIIVGASLFAVFVGNRGSDSEFEVHEWGVFVKEYNCTEVLVGGSKSSIYYPDYLNMQLYKPVIYFHSIEEKTNVKVQVDSVKNATVIPNATLKDDSIFWDVVVENDIIKTDEENDLGYNYLFYEGATSYQTNIDADIKINNVNVTFRIKNLEDFSISDVYFVYGKERVFSEGNVELLSGGMTYVYFENINSGEEKNITIKMMNESFYNASDMMPLLINKGLTNDESQELVDYWRYYWFYPNLKEYSRILYTIPQSEYDNLLPISIIPQPTSIKRVGIVTLTDIPLNP